MSSKIEKLIKLAVIVLSLVLLGTAVPKFLPDYAHEWALQISGGTMFPHQGQGFSLAENTLVLKMDEEAFDILEAACLHWMSNTYYLAYAGLGVLGVTSEGFLALTRWNIRNSFCIREELKAEKTSLEQKEQEIIQSVESLARRDEEISLLVEERDSLQSELTKVSMWQRSHEILKTLQAGLASLQQPVTEEVSVTEQT